MTIPSYPNLPYVIRKKPGADSKTERVETVSIQEQFTGLVPLRNERPAAEVLSERLAKADPANSSLVFIP